MLGISLEPDGVFPGKCKTVFLAESAASDGEIITKLEKHLLHGNNVILTSGFLRKMKGKGIEYLTAVEYTGKKVHISSYAAGCLGDSFRLFANGKHKVTIPQLEFPTNDASASVVGFSDGKSFPVLTESSFGKGKILVLTVPDNLSDFYHFPKEILSQTMKMIRVIVTVFEKSQR